MQCSEEQLVDALTGRVGIGILEARDMKHAVQLIAQHPSLKYGSVWEIRPAADMNEIIKASEQRRRKNLAR